MGKRIVLAVAMLLVWTNFSFAQYVVVGYYPDWGKWMTPSYSWDKVNFDQITHVAWSFLSPDANGKLRGNAVDDPSDLDSLVKKAHSADRKVLISLGGAGYCENFAAVASDKVKRAFFLHDLKTFLMQHDIDGVDMDWEYSAIPSSSDTAAYTKLIHDMRDTIGENLLFTAAIPCSPYYGKWFSVESFIDDLDWIGFMTYDITGSWDELARYNSPLFPNGNRTTWSWKETIDYFSSRGIPSSKMLPGVASFGFNFSDCSGPGTSFASGQAAYVGYASVAASEDWELYWDDVAKVPYALTPEGGYVTFDDPHSVAEKARWIKQNGLRGAIVWELSLDYMDSGEQPIMDSLSFILFKEETSSDKEVLSKDSNLLWNGSQLTFSAFQSAVIDVKIIDMDGRLMDHLIMHNNESLDLSFLPKGVYLIVVNEKKKQILRY